MNEKISAIIVDDEMRGLSAMERLLQLNCPEVQVMAFCKNATECEQAIEQFHPQLVFLDIAMPGKSGIEMLEDFKDPDFEVIFITAHNHYMMQALHFSAIDYLLKPIDDDLLTDAVARAAKRIKDKMSNVHLETLLFNIHHSGSPFKMKLCIPSQQGIRIVNIKEIIFCEAKSNYTNIYFESGPLICSSKSIHEYEELLQESGFLRIHKSYLVNLLHIKEYKRGSGGSVVLSNNFEAEVSRRKKDVLMNKIKEYFR